MIRCRHAFLNYGEASTKEPERVVELSAARIHRGHICLKAGRLGSGYGLADLGMGCTRHFADGLQVLSKADYRRSSVGSRLVLSFG